jgi:hypothetical protein
VESLISPMENEHKWDLVDAVSRSPLLVPPSIRPGIDLADVERRLLASEDLPASDRERLIGAVRELAEIHGRLGGSKAA